MTRASTAESELGNLPAAHPEPRARPSVFARFLFVLLFAAIGATGLYFAWRAAVNADARIRSQLLRQAQDIARSVDPETGRALPFTPDAPPAPGGNRLRNHLQAYCEVLKPRGVYTLARRGDSLFFGVESYSPPDPLASPVGTPYLRPPADIQAVFDRKRQDVVIGPVEDEYGTFVTALAPVHDPRTGEVLLAVGVDLLAEDWASAVRAASRTPLWLAGCALLLLGIWLTLRNRYRSRSDRVPALLRTETLFAAGTGILLTILTTSLLLETERRTRESNYDSLVQVMQTRLSQVVHLASGKMLEAEAFFRSRTDAAPGDFSPLLDSIRSEISLRFFAWIPETHRQELALGPGTRTAPPGLGPSIWPESETEFVLGPGLADPEVQALFRKAQAEDQPISSAPRPCPERPDRPGLIYLVRYLPPLRSEAAGWTRPGGWLAIGLEPDRAFRLPADSDFATNEVAHLCMVDITKSGERADPICLSYDPPGEKACLHFLSHSVFRGRSMARGSPLFLFDRTYVVTSYPTPRFLRAQAPRATQVAGIAELVFTGLLTLLVLLLRRRQSDLERGIRARTAEVQEREENLSVTLQSIGDGVIVTDLGDRIIRMNPTAERWTEWRTEEALGQPLQQVYRLDLSAADAQDPAGPGRLSPKRLIARSGLALPVSDSVSLIRNGTGESIGRIVVFRDITELLSAREALEHSERQYQLLFDGLACGFALHEVLTDPDGKPVDLRFLKTNSVFEHLLNREAGDLVGRTILELLPGTEPYWIEQLGRVALSGQPAHLEHLHSALNRYFDVDAYCPKPRQVATLVTDITERRRLEEDQYRFQRSLQQKQRLESLGVLAGGIAHDFNNILMIILGNAELVLQTVPNASPTRAPLQDIVSAARTAADLCRQMLAYAGRGRYVIEPLDLNRLVSEMEPILKTAVSKGGHLVYRLAPGVPAIEGDMSQLRQIILNLALNASEALRDGQGTITISSGALLCTSQFLRDCSHQGDLPEGLYVFLEVSDTGCGMSAEVLNRIFDPFFTTKFTGRGLGLAAVQGIVHSHRGGLLVTSEPGLGTSFKVFFPALGEPPRAKSPSAWNLNRKPLWFDRKTILLADPDLSVREVGGHLLEQLDVRILAAGSGPEALELFRKHAGEVSCALLDLGLNEKVGDNWAGALRAINPDLPILFSGNEELRQAPPGCPPKGQYGYLRKPYDINSLVDALNPLLIQPEPNSPGQPKVKAGKP